MRHVTLVTVAAVVAGAVWVASRPPPLEAQDRQVTFSMVEKMRGRLTRIEDRLKAVESVPTGEVTKEEIARFRRLQVVAEESRKRPRTEPLPPSLLRARLNANETSAISTLRTIGTSQAQFQTSAKADVDNDGTGEFGTFRELSGAVPVRTAADGSNKGGSKLNPTNLSGAFRRLNMNAEVSRSGYLFKMFFPGKGGAAVEEDWDGVKRSLSGKVDTDLSETIWCVYAWPANYGTSGKRTFFTNQAGDITGKDDSTMSGTGDIDTKNAGDAFMPGGGAGNITGRVAIGTVGRDGKVWKQVN